MTIMCGKLFTTRYGICWVFHCFWVLFQVSVCSSSWIEEWWLPISGIVCLVVDQMYRLYELKLVVMLILLCFIVLKTWNLECGWTCATILGYCEFLILPNLECGLICVYIWVTKRWKRECFLSFLSVGFVLWIRLELWFDIGVAWNFHYTTWLSIKNPFLFLVLMC